jgi:hypothetical protein
MIAMIKEYCSPNSRSSHFFLLSLPRAGVLKVHLNLQFRVCAEAAFWLVVPATL